MNSIIFKIRTVWSVVPMVVLGPVLVLKSFPVIWKHQKTLGQKAKAIKALPVVMGKFTWKRICTAYEIYRSIKLQTMHANVVRMTSEV